MNKLIKRWTDDWGIRWYFFENDPIIKPSVTSILDRVLSYQPKRVKDTKEAVKTYKKRFDNSTKARTRGKDLHDIIKPFILGERQQIDPVYSQDLVDLEKFLSKFNKIEPLFVEETLYHPQFHYAGAMDIVLKVDGIIELWDWKTGRGYSVNTGPQMAAYDMAIKALTGIEIERYRGIHINDGVQDFVYPKMSSKGPIYIENGIIWKTTEYCQETFLEAFQVFKRDKTNLLLKYGVTDSDNLKVKYYWDIDLIKQKCYNVQATK